MQKEMSFAEHLIELRSRLIKSAIAILCGAGVCGFFWRKILSFFTGYPLHLVKLPIKLIYTNPVEAFMISVKISLFGGLALSMPVVLFQIWRFVAPGLFRHEKTLVLPVVFFSTLFFFAGVAFAYFLTLPVALQFLLSYAPELSPMLKINDYIGFILMLSLAFGAIFELPVFSYVLARLGILSPGFLWKNFRYAVVLIFIVAAVLTPTPDAFSQCLMAFPMIALYFISIGVAWFAGRQRV